MSRFRFRCAARGLLPGLLLLALLGGCGQKGPLFVPPPDGAPTAPASSGTAGTGTAENAENEDDDSPPAAPQAVP